MKSKSPKRVQRSLKSKSPKRVQRSLKSKSPNRIDVSSLKRQSLTKYGYSSKKSVKERQSALTKAVKHYGSEVVWKKLNVVGILNKNRSPQTSDIFNKDKNWLKLKFIK